MTPPGQGRMDPRGTVGRIYKEEHYILLQTKYESSGPCCFGEDFFYVLPMTPPGRACMNPRGTVGRIYKEDHYTLLLTKYESSGPCDFFLCFSHCKSMGANDPRGVAIFDPRGIVGRIHKKDHYKLLHTKYEGSGPCGFGEEDFFTFWDITPPGWGLYGRMSARLLYYKLTL